jgi:hypothetical protein
MFVNARRPLSPRHQQRQANGSVPFAFSGNCDAAGNRLTASEMRGDVPSKVLARVPNNTCLPAGWLYKFTSLHDAGFSSPR